MDSTPTSRFAKHIGEQVRYRPFGQEHPHEHLGVITSVDDLWVWVRYEDDEHAKATNPNTLHLV